ncbi:unnamed protein product, partial [Amoebophrya sp. A25]|eukprot:GSA25T00000122001.1
MIEAGALIPRSRSPTSLTTESCQRSYGKESTETTLLASSHESRRDSPSYSSTTTAGLEMYLQQRNTHNRKMREESLRQ